MGNVPPFAEFYAAVNAGRAPFPWQTRLATTVAAECWPAEIGVPTGLGKTACIDIAVWSLAWNANDPRRRAPTRTWYVVNRRLLVDAAWERAVRLAAMLADPATVESSGRAAVGAVAAALVSLTAFGTDHGPLHVARLRGGAELGSRSPDPSQPCLILATVPMFASRWLFRGFGSSRSMRPLDAAHAGIDSLVLMDEAHLARPILSLAGHAAACDAGDPARVVPGMRGRPQFVSLTATGEGGPGRFDLDGDDLRHPIVARRLNAPKRGRLVATTKNGLPETLAAEAVVTLHDVPATCVVFVNTAVAARSTATSVEKAARQAKIDAEVVLVTGRVRDREGDRLRAGLLSPDGVRAGAQPTRSRSLVVVATQTLEVGADVDFDHLITESTGVRSLVQRLGRVNRLGDRAPARCVVCHAADRKDWPVYGLEPAAVWDALTRHEAAGRGLDLSPGSVTAILGPPQDLPPRVGQLLPAHLWEWAKTTVPPRGEAPVELFFDGFDAERTVAVVWRAHRPPDGIPLVPAVAAGESVDIPAWELAEVLGDIDVRRLDDDRAALETVAASRLQPGDVVVLDPADGLYDEHGWNPSAHEVVLDVAPLHSGVLVLSAHVLGNLAPGSAAKVRPALDRLAGHPEDEEVDEQAAIGEILAVLRDSQPHPWLGVDEWQAFLGGLGTTVVRPVGDMPLLAPPPAGRRWSTVGVRNDSLDELSFVARSCDLDEHVGAVGEAGGLIAARIGLDPALVRAVEVAGQWHDLGKHDPRFQRWLDPDASSTRPLAKSKVAPYGLERARIAAGWPKGGRHELLSSRLLTAWLEHAEVEVDVDVDLVIHLVASHHGQGRPSIRAVGDPAPSLVAAEVGGVRVAVSGDLGLPDWDQPRRFRHVSERYGYWGVALLEAIVRQADHAASSQAAIA